MNITIQNCCRLNNNTSIPINVIDIGIPRARDKMTGFKPSMKKIGKIINDDNWLPKYTDKIAATGTEEATTPNKIPIEHVIAIEEKLINKYSNVVFKRFSDKLPVNPSIIKPIEREIATATTRHK